MRKTMYWIYLYLEFSTQHWWLLPFSSHLLNCKDFISIECFVPFWYVHIWLFLVTKLPKYFICLANRKHCTENHATLVTKNQKRSYQNVWWAEPIYLIVGCRTKHTNHLPGIKKGDRISKKAWVYSNAQKVKSKV